MYQLSVNQNYKFFNLRLCGIKYSLAFGTSDSSFITENFNYIYPDLVVQCERLETNIFL